MALNRSKLRILFVILALVAVGVTIHIVLNWGRESTDDATIEAHVVPIAPKVPGYVAKLNIQDNEEVKQGDILLEIDPRDYEIARDRAQAELVSAQAKFAAAGHNYATTKVQAPSSLDSARAQMKSSEAEWTRAAQELRRMQRLGDAARSRRMLEDAVAAEKAARSNYEDAKARLSTANTAPNTIAAAEANVKDLDAAVAIAQSNLAKAEKDLADTKILAPFDGRVTRRTVEAGAYVQPGQQLMTVVSNEIWVVANYKENQIDDMKPGQPVSIRIDAYKGDKFTGKVDSIQKGTGARFSAFPPENATGNFVKIVQRVPVKILFEKQPDAKLAIGPGMSVVPKVDTR